MADPPAPFRRDRWLRVVGDDERAPAEPPASGRPDGARVGSTAAPPPPDRPAPRPAGRSAARPADHPAPRPAGDRLPAADPATSRPAGRRTQGRSAEGRPGRRWSAERRPGEGPARPARGGRGTGAGPDRGRLGRGVRSRGVRGRGVRGRGVRGRAVARLWMAAALGTATAVGADALVGDVDGRPAVYLLVLFLVPFWDRLPARVSARLAVLAGVAAAVAAGWYGLSAVHDAGWWPAGSFGLACALAGTVPLLLAGPRTVDR